MRGIIQSAGAPLSPLTLESRWVACTNILYSFDRSVALKRQAVKALLLKPCYPKARRNAYMYPMVSPSPLSCCQRHRAHATPELMALGSWLPWKSQFHSSFKDSAEA